MPPRKFKQMNGVDNTVTLHALGGNQYIAGDHHIAGDYDIGGKYPYAGEYVIAGNYPIGGKTKTKTGMKGRDINYVEDHIISDREDTENVGGGFFDDVFGNALGPFAPVVKKIVGGKKKGGAVEDFIPLAEKTGKALGWLAIKALGGNIKSNDSNAVMLGMLERINRKLGLPEYTQAEHTKFMSHLSPCKCRKGGEVAHSSLLGADEVSKPPRQYRMSANELL